MIEAFSNNITKILLNNLLINKTETELYQYGIRVLLQNTVNLLSVFLIGCLFGELSVCMLLYVAYALVRMFSGGLHAKKYSVCFIFSNLIMVCSMLLIKNYFLIPDSCWLIGDLFSALTLISVVPVEHPNKKLSKRERNIFKKTAIFISLLYTILGMVLLLTSKKYPYGYILILSVFICSVLAICGKIKYKSM